MVISGTVLAMIVRVSGVVEVGPIPNNLAALQEIVGGWIEGVTLRDDGTHLYCNEEGKLRGLPPNPAATAIADACRPGFAATDQLVGDVVFLGSTPAGNEADVPAWLVAAVMPLTREESP